MDARAWRVVDAGTGEELARTTHPYSAELLARKWAAVRGTPMRVLGPDGRMIAETAPPRGARAVEMRDGADVGRP